MVLSWSEKEEAVIELLRQRKKIREIAQELRVSSRDISRIKKKYGEEEQNKIGPHQDQKCGPSTETHDNLKEENRALKHKKIELDYKLKHKYIESRSGIVAIQTKSLYDDAYRLLDQDVEYCYLVYRNNRYERLVDAARYEADRGKARWDEEKAKEEPKQENITSEAPDDGLSFRPVKI